VVYYGRSSDCVRRDAERFGLESITDCRGFVPQDQLRAHVRSADVLLLPTNEAGDSGVPGGKLYEYLAARRPILAVPGQDRFVARVLEETRAGVSATSPDDVAGALKLWSDELSARGVVAYRGDEKAVNRYSIKESARRVAEVLDATVDNNGALSHFSAAGSSEGRLAAPDVGWDPH
jgi:glycosyltransferase involved in cell wall biosynthesis